MWNTLAIPLATHLPNEYHPINLKTFAAACSLESSGSSYRSPPASKFASLNVSARTSTDPQKLRVVFFENLKELFTVF